MKSIQVFTLLASLNIILSPPALTQGDYVQTGLQAYDVPVDARSVAMGESFVALTGNQNAMMYNPAGLGAIRGAQLSYSRRKFNKWSLAETFRFHQVNGTLETPYVNMGFSYNRYTSGEIAITLPQDSTRTVEYFEYAFAVAFGRRFGSNWDVGISFKTYDSGLNFLSGSGFEPITTGPFLVDLGLIFTAPIGVEMQLFTHSFSVGASIQNLGGKLKTTFPSVLGSPSTQETSLPHYVRVGFTYGIVVNGEKEDVLETFSVLASGEYRTFLNGSDIQSASKDFWGFGLEMKAMEIVSVRLSGFVNPYRSVYGDKGVPALRYGFGLSLPFQKLGTSLPITVQFDYAGIPPQIPNSFSANGETRTMQVFSVSVAFTNEIF